MEHQPIVNRPFIAGRSVHNQRYVMYMAHCTYYTYALQDQVGAIFYIYRNHAGCRVPSITSLPVVSYPTLYKISAVCQQ